MGREPIAKPADDGFAGDAGQSALEIHEGGGRSGDGDHCGRGQDEGPADAPGFAVIRQKRAAQEMSDVGWASITPSIAARVIRGVT